MPRAVSSAFAENIAATSADEPEILLLELDHPDWIDTLYLVVDNDHFPYGQEYIFVPGAVAVLNQVITPAEHNGYFYKVTAGGALAGAEPAWPTSIGGTVASGAATLRCEGVQYGAVAVDISLPPDQAGQQPRVPIAFDNVDPEISRRIEASGGGEGLTVRLKLTLRSQPGVIEFDSTLDLLNIVVTPLRITGELAKQNFLDKPAVGINYTPKTAPGLY